MLIKNRQLEIILYLNEVKKTTLSELAERFEASRRTIMRDIDAISALGVPVYARSGYKGGVYLEENYRFDRSFFSQKEIEDLILALHIAGQLKKDDCKNSIMKKLELLLPELTLAKEKDFYEYVRVEPLLISLDEDDPIFQKINLALDDEVWILVTCNQKDYRIVPLYYVLGSNGLSLCGSDGEQKLLFLVEKITDCTLTDQEFDRQAFQKFYCD